MARVTVVEGRIIDTRAHHVLYSALGFPGDSGGALLIEIDQSGNYCVFGVHIESVNAARERSDQNESIGEAVNDLSQSVKSLIRSSAEGYIGVLIDDDMLR